jgi:hypothetical protein
VFGVEAEKALPLRVQKGGDGWVFGTGGGGVVYVFAIAEEGEMDLAVVANFPKQDA